MKGKFAVQIGGRYVTKPGVYYDSDDSAMVPQRGNFARTALLIALAAGGATGEAMTLRPGDEARVLKSGLGAQMAAAMFRHGATEIVYLSPTVATPASLDLGRVRIEALNPGRAGRGLQVMTSASVNLSGAFDLFVRDAQGVNSPETYRDLGPVLEIRYAGAGAPALTVSAVGGTPELEFADGDAASALNISAAQVATFADLVTVLNSTDNWSARIVGDASYPVTALDATQPFVFAENRTLIGVGTNALAFKLRDSKLVSVQPGQGAQALRLTNTYEFLSGGAEAPAPTTADWVSALRKAELLDVQGVVLGTSDRAALAALAGHVEAMSAMTSKRERTGVFGAAQQPSRAAFLDAAVELAGGFSDSRLLTCAGNEPYDADVLTGVLTAQPACVAAAATLALRHSMNVEEPLTAKYLRFPRWKYDFTTEDVERLIDAGVMPIAHEIDAGRVLISAGITTYTLDANTMRRKQAGVEIDLYLARKARKVLFELGIGQVADEPKLESIKVAVQKMLEGETRDGKNTRGILTPGVDAAGNRLPSFQNLTLVFDGFDLLGIDFEAHPVGEIGYIRFSPRWTPVRITASA